MSLVHSKVSSPAMLMAYPTLHPRARRRGPRLAPSLRVAQKSPPPPGGGGGAGGWSVGIGGWSQPFVSFGHLGICTFLLTPWHDGVYQARSELPGASAQLL